jgi:hypothetical protein
MTSTLMSSRSRAVHPTPRLPDDRTNSSTGELCTPSGIGLAPLHQAPIPGEKYLSTDLRFPASATPRIKNVDFLLQVLDLILFSLIYPLTKGSSFYSVLSLVAVCKDSSVLLKSAFRNRLYAHETLDYRGLSGFIGFRFSIPLCPFATPLLSPPFCTKFTILHKITQRHLQPKQLKTSHLQLKTSLAIPTPLVQTSITKKPQPPATRGTLAYGGSLW